MRLRPLGRLADPRILLVTVTERDIQKHGTWPLPDGILAEAVEMLGRHQPRAIGLDIYRDIPVPPGSARLAAATGEEGWREAALREVAEETGIAFHYDAPGAEAPQLVLVVPPSSAATAWQTREVFDTLSETLEAVELAHKNGAVLVPFLLEGVGGVPALNQSDGIHPTAEGQQRMAETVWQVLEPVLRERSDRRVRPASTQPGGEILILP